MTSKVLSLVIEAERWRIDNIGRDNFTLVHAAVAALPELQKLLAIADAAQNLCDVKGRHHSERAMKRLMEACASKE